MSKPFLLAAILLLSASSAGAEGPPKFIEPGQRVIFLGDSNTYAGHYVALLDAYFRTARPDLNVELINVGLSSETACGLSEPAHPFPRPNVHDRLDRALAMLQPDIVVACYGMNDGVYYPFDEARFAAYRAGIAQLIRKVDDCGAKLVLLTPPAFDPLPMRRDKKLRPADAESFAWFGIYEGYDQVIARYARWVLEEGKRRSQAPAADVAMTIDIHDPIATYLADQRRDDPTFAMSTDGVHFDEAGHRIIADTLWRAWGLGDPPHIDDGVLPLIEERTQLLRDAWLTAIGHKRPGTPTGPPLDQANTRAETLDEQIGEAIHAKGGAADE